MLEFRPCRRKSCPRRAGPFAHDRGRNTAPSTMSCDGTMIGWPLAGMQDVVGRHHQGTAPLSSCASQRQAENVHGPSGRRRSRRLNAAAKPSGLQLDRLAFDQNRLERLDAEAMQRRRPRGLSSTGCSRITSSRMSQDLRTLLFSTSFFGLPSRLVGTGPLASSRE